MNKAKRKRMLEEKLELVNNECASARKLGMERPVIIVASLNDKWGSSMAKSCFFGAVPQEIIRGDGNESFVVFAMDYSMFESVMKTHPWVHRLRPTVYGHGRFYVASMTAGGTFVRTMTIKKDPEKVRLGMFHFQRERVEQYYLEFIKLKPTKPIVFVIDPRDEAGRGIAVALVGEEKVKKRIRKSVRENTIPTVLAAVTFDLGYALLSQSMSPHALKVLKQARQRTDSFIVAVVAEGGTRLNYCPIPSKP